MGNEFYEFIIMKNICAWILFLGIVVDAAEDWVQGHLDVKRNIHILWKVENDRVVLKTQFQEGTYLGIGLNDVANSGMAFAEMVAIGVRSDKAYIYQYSGKAFNTMPNLEQTFWQLDNIGE